MFLFGGCYNELNSCTHVSTSHYVEFTLRTSIVFKFINNFPAFYYISHNFNKVVIFTKYLISFKIK